MSDLVFTPTPSLPTLDPSLPNLDASLRAQIQLLIQHELDVLTESEWFIEFVDERITQAFEINEED
ncbi:MAG: hypothetical protein CMJ25_21280 [Phycisphaerae bacterium]|nr:hypothetical protein [Phycisphaerae bacterium]|tara:strand:- start:21210 stop:21407 length:198 start_codon:yes stop_codon:yes gene_type:complete